MCGTFVNAGCTVTKIPDIREWCAIDRCIGKTYGFVTAHFVRQEIITGDWLFVGNANDNIHRVGKCTHSYFLKCSIIAVNIISNAKRARTGHNVRSAVVESPVYQ